MVTKNNKINNNNNFTSMMDDFYTIRLNNLINLILCILVKAFEEERLILLPIHTTVQLLMS